MVSILGVTGFLEFKKNGGYYIIASVEIEFSNGSIKELSGSDEIIPEESVHLGLDEKTGENIITVDNAYKHIVQGIVQEQAHWREPPRYVEYAFF
jgi:hypothetical protein